MIAEIITIGDEILIGQIVDTNSAYIAKKLNHIGVDVGQITSIQDTSEHIKLSLSLAAKRANIIIITGGLGPTNDDLTKKTLCDYFKDTYVVNESVLAHVEELFKEHISTPISQLNRDQALIPSKAIALNNQYGTAPGMWFDENGVVYISLPGVPYEMKALIEDEVLPRLQQRFERPHILHKTVLTYGVGESAIAEKIEAWENALPSHIKLAYLPSLGRVRLRLSARGKEKQFLQDSIDSEIEKLQDLIGDIMKGFEEEATLEEQIAQAFVHHQKTLVTAESCTGGEIASRFTAIPGASKYFIGSIVTYATSSKNDVLGIPETLIEEHSVVSEDITLQMAIRARKMFKADMAIATTGNAGPTKGDSEAEIGTVYIALVSETEEKVYHFNFGNLREKVIEKAVIKAQEILLDYFSK
ncbi:CinA family nicotinamide mononucleotide deamidase-related protein [Mesonia sp. MT50]|uniref:CinA-like protein n=1 Tax=Mesonia profundi TaxID=3070998 RepID=A0ABU0ZZN2_9FLAO|nr:CinA family nicotinamide mononucleotide deamidase-related protein [Mesonia profundi]MDQ7916829.1 CinA family nicotinamide mononucleotide deamidase-related protein [Mesonia profundi]